MLAAPLGALALMALLQAPKGPVDRAWDLLARHERGAAVELLEKTIRAEPRNAEARLLLGSVLMEEGRRDESIAQLTEAVHLRPNSAEAQNALGEAYRAFEDPKAARPAFEKAVQLNPKFAAAQVNLGQSLLESGEMDGAAAHLDRGIALLGHSADAALPLYLRAKIDAEKGQTADAVRALERAVALRPDFGEAWSDLGAARKAMLDDAGALSAFERAVAFNPHDAVAQTRLGEQLLTAGKSHDAVPHFEEAVRLAPTDQSALNGLQRALRDDGRTAEAGEIKKKLEQLLRAKDRSDQNSLVAVRLNNEGADLEKSGDLPGAAEKYRKALELDPGHNGIRVNLAVALLRLGQWKEGLAQLQEALKRDPDNSLLKAAWEDALTQAPVEFGGKGKGPGPASAGAKY